LANPFILASGFVFAAIAVPGASTPTSWLRRVLARTKKSRLSAAAPVISREEGWTLIRCDDPSAFNSWLGLDEIGLPSKPDEEPSLGSHLLVELYGCEASALENEASVASAMHEAAVQSEATVVAQSFHEFKPYGVSGAVIIQESHYTIHTWPEHGYAAVDLFYCGGTVRVHKAVEVLQDRFKPERIKFLVVRRGIQSEVTK
jgi:S-adenosylmethionine decarboxylase